MAAVAGCVVVDPVKVVVGWSSAVAVVDVAVAAVVVGPSAKLAGVVVDASGGAVIVGVSLQADTDTATVIKAAASRRPLAPRLDLSTGTIRSSYHTQA